VTIHVNIQDILQSYFRNAATYYPNAADAGRTTYFSKVGMDFMDASAFAMSGLKPTFPLFSRHVNLLQLIASFIRGFHDDPEANPSLDYLFFVSFTYVYGLLLRKSGRVVITTETGRDLILALLQYYGRVSLRKDIEDAFHNWHDSWRTFDESWNDLVDCARELGIVVLPPAQELVADLAPLERAEIQESDHQSGDAVVEVLHDHHASTCSSSKLDDG